MDQENFKTKIEDFGEEEYGSQMVDTYLAKANVMDSKNLAKASYFDSRASNHVTGDCSIFSSLASSSGTKITLVGGYSHEVIGNGNVAIKLPSSEIQKISHVLYSPSITKNLISVGFLVDRGFILEFMRLECVIKTANGFYIGSAIRNATNGLYKLQGDTLLGCAEVSYSQVHALTSLATSSKANLWHKRLRHFHP